MPNAPILPKKLLDRIALITNKRARLVLDKIVKNGAVTTEELQLAGYEHPPRAAQDVRDLGFRLKTTKVKHTNGRTIAAYVFHEWELEAGKNGRRLLPKKEREALIHAGGHKCNICEATHNLQVDHRIPYEVAGESQREEAQPYQILCGSCNRKKSWDCEHCPNSLQNKDFDVCLSCYWAEPINHTHICTQQQRRIDIVWSGNEINEFEGIKYQATKNQISVTEEIKQLIKKKFSGK